MEEYIEDGEKESQGNFIVVIDRDTVEL